MYQYKAILTTTQEVIAEGHTVEEVEQNIIHFRRGQKHGEHTHGHDRVDIIHVERDKVHGGGKEKLIKTV